MLQTGADKKIGDPLAPVIGLTKAADVKQQDVIIHQDKHSVDVRSCFLVFAEKDKHNKPMGLFIRRTKQTLESSDSRYFKINLHGKLEKVVDIRGKRTAEKVIRGSGTTTNRDIESPAVKKEFETEMAFWLKDWLKKEQKAPAAKAAPAKS